MSDSPTSVPKPGFVCDWQDQMPACVGEPFYKEHEGKRYCVLHFPRKEKSADFEKALQRKLENKDFNFRGVWFPEPLLLHGREFDRDVDFSFSTFSAEASFSSAKFSALANFDSATFSAAADFSAARFTMDADFNSAIFDANASFSVATFSAEADFGHAYFGADASFSSATFSAKAKFLFATFKGFASFTATFNAAAQFGRAYFSEGALFSRATFSAAAQFGQAYFGAMANFSDATFGAQADFSSATFSAEADFSAASFSAAADFSKATLGSYFKFAGDENKPVFSDASSLSLQFARIENPERFSFHTLRLRPHWLVNVDARKVEFINVKWQLTTSEEIKELNLPKKKRNWHSGDSPLGASTHQLLAIAFRNLAVNAEENHRYEEASRFRYMAMDVRRRERWRRLAFWRLSWWYWLASGYGERVSQAFLVLLGILFLSAVLYTQLGFARWEPRLSSESEIASAKRDNVGAPLEFRRALGYSAGVLTFQRPEPRPATTAAQTVVLLETILGPVQAALLALAIRRKFMR